MPSGSYKQVDTKCPFYRSDDGKRKITCEGIIDDSSLTLAYRYKNDYAIQINVFCCEHYKKCEIYRMLLEKYQDEEEQ